MLPPHERLAAFLEGLKGDIYPEPLAEPHRSIIEAVVGGLVQRGLLAPGMRVLDVGCGQGFACERFRAAGADPVGITLGPDLDACRAKRLEVREMDLSFLDFEDTAFDLVWCRHALEHSVFPLFTLAELRRVARPGGLLYVEVPAPDTACHHERNANHYSVLGNSMWRQLFARSGLDLVEAKDIRFTVPAGPDLYWSFLLRRPA
jgi:SAM-dependent methyltransferase